jgi:hypothetical protein
MALNFINKDDFLAIITTNWGDKFTQRSIDRVQNTTGRDKLDEQ